MKIGVTQIILGKMTLDETLDLCQEAGYEAVELVFGEDRDLDVNMGTDQLAAVAERCEDAGVEIGSIIAHYADRGNLMSRNAAEREKSSRSLERALQIAGGLNVGTVLLHPGQLAAEGTYREAWDDMRDALVALADVAEANRAAIAVENVWNKFLLSPKEAAELVDEVDSPWVGIYLDTANMMAYGYPEHWIRELGSRIKRVHLKDFKRSDHAFVNLLDGDTDWPVVMSELRAQGYESTLIHEVGGDRATLVDLGERMRRIVAM